jgi:hypothetical protein
MKIEILIIVGIISIIIFVSTLYYDASREKIKEGLDTPSPNSLVPIPNTGIPDGYYKYNNSSIAPVPYGYIASTDKTQIFPKTLASKWTDIGSKQLDNVLNPNAKNKSSYSTSTSKSTPDSNNNKYSNDLSKIMNTQYHSSDADLMNKNDGMDISFGQTWIYDMCGNKVVYPSLKIQGDRVYYTPGSYPFGASNYVPSYEDSIYLSKTTGLSSTSPYRAETKSTGFCNYNKNSPDNIEQSCRKLDTNICASTECCVLLGGSTCVEGNEHGPKQKANYGDIFIRNKDYYYYRGKCYGNCSS